MIAFLVIFLCSFTLAADYYSIVQVEGKATPDTVKQQGDSLTLDASLLAGDNFVEWVIESGSGYFSHSKNPKTKFVAKSSNVTLRINKKNYAYNYKVLADTFVGFDFYNDAFYTSNEFYGTVGKFLAKETGQYSIKANFKNSISFPKLSTDSLFIKNESVKYDKVYFYFSSESNTINYLNFRHPDFSNNNDSIYVKIGKSRTLSLLSEGPGVATLDSAGNKVTSYSKFIAGDSVSITASIDSNNNFIRWENLSTTCSLIDPLKTSTKVVIGNGNCNLKAIFTPGIFYNITTTPTKYSVKENLFSTIPANNRKEVRFIFTPPSNGQYYIYASGSLLYNSTDSLRYARSTNDEYKKYYKAQSFSGTIVDTINGTAGTPIYTSIRWNSNQISNEPFWISYEPVSSATYSLKISSNTQGKTLPENGYTKVNTGVKLSIGAKGNEGFRFEKWEVVSGDVSLDDPSTPFTYATLSSNAEIRASYQAGNLYTLTFNDQTFNFQNHYYHESTGSETRFTWTPPDNSNYAIMFIPIDSIVGIYSEYNTDQTFKNLALQKNYSEPISVLFKGNENEPLFWSYKDSSSIIPNKSFKAKISKPTILEITSNNNGSTNPKGKSFIAPNTASVITAWPYGGYTFSSWKKVSGNCPIENTKKSITTITPHDTECAIEATFVIDVTAQPKIKIDNLDLGNYPGICAQVSVSDQFNRSINGLTSKDFILFQDSTSLGTQVYRVNEVSSISTVLVVDQSNSMSFNNRMEKSKDALRSFVKDMGTFDKAAIVGFFGGDSTFVHQEMTSDTNLLLASISKLNYGGNTNIFSGTLRGINQALHEINPSAVIVFSDGENGTESVYLDNVVKAARDNNTSIYTIGLETTIEHPLKDLADSTGGTFTFASDASELAGIYSAIRDNIQSKYIVCYQTPDTVLNGDKHDVKISTSLLGKETSATTNWQESFMPPTITITDATWELIQNSQPTNVAIPIQVHITASSPIESANIYIRPTDRKIKTFQTYSLTHVSGNLWQYIVPENIATVPGIDFYITATDSAGFVGKNPKIPSPSREPYTIAIENDLPRISLVSATCEESTKGFKTFVFRVADNDDVAKVSIFYKEPGDVLFQEKNLYHKSVEDSTWFISIPSDASVSSGIDFYVRAYDTNGASSRWDIIGYQTTEACFVKEALYDLPDTISIVSANPNETFITRSTENIKLIVKTEDFSSELDTIIVNLQCLVSGDMEESIYLFETNSGTYEAIIPKDEFIPRRNNGAISCTGNDTLLAIYKDPAFGTFTFSSVAISNYVQITYQFLEPLLDENLDSIETNKDANFRLRVTTTSENMNRIDTVMVMLFNEDDTVFVNAIETDINSATFDYIGKFYFVDDSTEKVTDRFEGILDYNKTINRKKIQAQVASDTSSLVSRDSLIIFTNYVAADSAEIYDKNLDGQADFVRIHFKEPLQENIQSIDTIFWNEGHKNPSFVKPDNIKMSNDKFWVEVKLDSAFKYGKTSANSSNIPYLRLTKTANDRSQKVAITDKVGAVPIKAEKRPGKVSVEDYLKSESPMPPDTLVITLSEMVSQTTKDEKAWKELFRYSKTCKDTASKPVKISGKPKITENGLIWRFLLDDYGVLVNNCIRTNPDADYIDLVNNNLGRGGVTITGNDGTLYLYEAKANPSVSGIGQKAKWIPPKGKNFENVPDTISTIRFSVVAPFKANIYIYDEAGYFVEKLEQKFGYHGEMEESIRQGSNKHAKIGYLYWNQRSSKGRKVGTGVYIWKIVFAFEDGYKETVTLKSGVHRKSHEK